MPDQREGFPAAPAGAVATGAGNRRELLLSAVIADPANLDARLVYADALVAANDPRGEFIQLDTALDGPLSIRKREALQLQRDAMFQAHAKTWWPYANVRLRVTKGFVEAISGFPAKIDAAATLFISEPIIEVEVRGLRGIEGVERLLACAWLPRVRRLIVRGKIGDAGFAALVVSPAVAQLEALNVTGNRIAAQGIAALQDRLPKLRSLVLSSNPLDDAGITGLAGYKHLANLETLYLGTCGLTAVGVDRLLERALPKLGKLALAGNKLGNGVGATLAGKAHQLPALRHLDLQKTGLGTVGATHVSEARLPALKKIDLRANRLDATLVANDPRIVT